MKLAVFTDEVSQDLDRAVKMATRFGLDGVELRSVWNKPVQHLSQEEVARVRTMLEEHGLRVCAIASPVFKCELDDEAAHRDHLDYLRSCIQIAKALRTDIIRLFTFWKRGPSQPVWARIKRQFRPAVPIAEGEGVILGVENEASTYVATAAEAKQFVAEIDSPAVRIVWDPCNEVYADEGITPYPDAYRLVEPWMVHLHVKDGKREPATDEPHVVPVGEGAIDWKGQLRELVTKQYDGYASLETHWRPGGEIFSEAGEYASQVCLEKLMEILAAARREAN